jgi:hypothetical protein
MLEIILALFPMLVDQMKSDGKDVSKLDSYEYTTKAKIYEGMTAIQVIEQFGMPTSAEKYVSIYSNSDRVFYYRGDMCDGPREYSCPVFFTKGKVDSYMHFKPIHQKF